ncbi:MAG TPA: hypothetical protein VNZ52_07535, partial [Candidatus Thermoplasmatota archaeon]|nr:hypothetical protein [Candidatus Thermoplasmatota archaeon]
TTVSGPAAAPAPVAGPETVVPAPIVTPVEPAKAGKRFSLPFGKKKGPAAAEPAPEPAKAPEPTEGKGLAGKFKLPSFGRKK